MINVIFSPIYVDDYNKINNRQSYLVTKYLFRRQREKYKRIKAKHNSNAIFFGSFNHKRLRKNFEKDMKLYAKKTSRKESLSEIESIFCFILYD